MVKFACYNWMPDVADHVLDSPRQHYLNAGVKPMHNKANFNPYRVKNGDLIFVKTDFIVHGVFQEQYLDKILCNFNLITGVSSYNIGRDGGDNYLKIVEHPGLKKWFCTNPPTRDHHKIIPLPIGFEEPDRPGGDQGMLQKMYDSRTPWQKKKNKIFMPYHNLSTNSNRQVLFDRLKGLPFVEFQKSALPVGEYIKLLDQYKFVICLEGAGPDVHRNYEAMLVGCIPINKKNVIKKVFDYHSAKGIFLNSWDDLDNTLYENLIQYRHDALQNDNLILLKNYYSLIGDMK